MKTRTEQENGTEMNKKITRKLETKNWKIDTENERTTKHEH